MQTYSLYIEDDRYSVPTLLFVDAADDASALRTAREKLAKPHHMAIEVREGDRVVERVTRRPG
jgi:hypothetical protein